jgi:ribonuclease HI
MNETEPEIGKRSIAKFEDAQIKKKIKSTPPPKRGRQILVFFDGSCWPNPNGKMGLGVVFYEATGFRISYANSRNPKSSYRTLRITNKFSRDIEASPNNTNNVAEHSALNLALLHIKNRNFHNEEIFIFGDSQMTIKQMNKEYCLSTEKKYYEKAKENMNLLFDLSIDNKFEFIWIPRELNALADSLSKI